MKIRYKTRAAGPDGVRRPGETAEVSENQARQLVEGGYAEALGPMEDKAPEKKTAYHKAKAARK